MSWIKSNVHAYRYEIFLFLAALLIRLPFFFRDYIDHDESTFILMGQSVADGHLPYVHIWDLKSPFLFYIFAAVETLFPRSFVAIRFTGVVVIFISAILMLRIAKRAGLQNVFLVALSYVILSSEFGSVQGVMSEHFAVLFILGGLYFFIREPQPGSVFLSGLFFGCALLCKLNYAYAILLVYLYFILRSWRNQKLTLIIGQLALAGFGVLLPFFIVAIPFLVQNELKLFIDCVFFAPLTYGHYSSPGGLQNLSKTWWIILVAIVMIVFAWKRSTPNQRNFTAATSLLLAGTVYSFYTTGKVNGHYLIQAYPFMILLVLGIIIKKEPRIKLGWVALIVTLISIESILEYSRVFKHMANAGTAYNGKSYIALNELKKHGLEDRKIFFSDYHIGYWILRKYPLTKSTTHPSNIARSYLFKYYRNPNTTAMQEVRDLAEKVKPEVMVSKYSYLAHFQPLTPEERYFTEVLEREYQFIYKDSVNRIYIWKRNDLAP